MFVDFGQGSIALEGFVLCLDVFLFGVDLSFDDLFVVIVYGCFVLGV